MYVLAEGQKKSSIVHPKQNMNAAQLLHTFAKGQEST